MYDEISRIADELRNDGFAIASGVVCAGMLDELRSLCRQSQVPSKVRRRGESLYGIRQLLIAIPRLQEIANAPPFIDLAKAVLGNAARSVKGVFFDKNPAANWSVPWHQDATITVRERRDVPGFEMRPVKDGAVHAVPPVGISEQMLALRIHLDPTGPDHGALRVLRGSHRHGRLTASEVALWVAQSPEEFLSTNAGDVVLMRPLLLHASSSCVRPEHRRVIHIEYSARELPGGLEWAG